MGLFDNDTRAEVLELRAEIELQSRQIALLSAQIEERNAQWDLVAEQITHLCSLIVTVAGMHRPHEEPDRGPMIILAHQPPYEM